MIKIILLVWYGTIISDPAKSLPLQKAGRRTINYGLKANPFKIVDGFFYHSLKAQAVTDVDNLLFGDILISHNKTDPIALRIGICHKRNGLLRKLL